MSCIEFGLASCPTRLEVYNTFQVLVMWGYIRSGGSAENWCVRYAATSRRSFGWMQHGDAL